ncbi:unnamed protein product [Cylindrotheca closterium]|uniref:Uncharacterized protein n=1 Tax=Cylindrotheca closterium TaxID=2856 RepID=A0AAD2CVQ5_9STRA|nr:unnamed protein product [Cylindrotheca closterium]
MLLHLFIYCLFHGTEALQAAVQSPGLRESSPLKSTRTQTRNKHLLDETTFRTDNWKRAKQDLKRKDCCVVSIDNLDPQLKLLQHEIADNGPSDVDLRARIRTSMMSSSTESMVHEDCLQVLESVLGLQPSDSPKKYDKTSCAVALQDLAIGMASMAEGSSFRDEKGEIRVDVFCRIVCASNYRARDPPYHTDKAPFRGYATLRGVGTEYLNRPSSPLEYFQLRTFGNDGLDASTKETALCSAEEGQFIVMKGDYYYDFADTELRKKEASSLLDSLWARSRACVHRSPQGSGQRRVIISFDLDDGDDDREWYQAGTKREWRNGLTQRKSRLVA